MEYFFATGIFIAIIAGLAYLYLSIYFNTKSYIRKVKKYKKIQLYQLNKKFIDSFKSKGKKKKRRGS